MNIVSMKLGKPKRFKTPSSTHEDFSERKINIGSKITNQQESSHRNHNRSQRLRTSSENQFGQFVIC